MPKLEERDGALVVSVEGEFNSRTALKLAEALDAHRPKPQRVVLQFGKLTSFSKLAVAVLAPKLAGRAVELHGLKPHQRRAFESFGVNAPEAPAA